MIALNYDIAIFIIFLIANLFVGLAYGRGVKNIQDYALGGRNFSTGSLIATIVATFVTGSSFFVTIVNTYSDGITYTIAGIFYCLQVLIVGLFLIPKMGEFMGALSVAEVMGNLYDKRVRFITAVSGILWNVGGIAVQFKVFGTLFNYFLGIPSVYAILIASSVIIMYSAFGGIRAVTSTDILQFFTFGIVLPLVGVMIWNDFQGQGMTVSAALDRPLFNYHRILSLQGKELFDFIFLILYFSFPVVGPVDFQRISMGRNIRQVKTAFIISAALLIFFELVMAWIPFLVSNIKPGLESNQVVSYIVNNYTYAGMKGLVIIGVSAMAMSSADSFINGSAVLFGYDLKEVFGIRVDNLTLSKIFAVVLGIFATFLALSTDNLLDMVMRAASFYMPVVGVPLLLSILGFRSSSNSVLISMVAGLTTVLLWDFLNVEVHSIVPAMVVNFIALMGSHYLLNQAGGWTVSKRNKSPSFIQEKKRELIKLANRLSFSYLIGFCKKTAPKNEIVYTWLGIYFICYTFSTIYSTQVASFGDKGKTILAIYQIMMCTGTLTATFPIWPHRIKQEIIMQLAWNFIIFYMLVFFSGFFVMISDFGQLQFAVFTLNIVITGLLVGWRLSLVMMSAGFYLAVEFYKYYMGVARLDFTIGSPQFVLMYTLMLIGTALIIFLRPKQEEYALTEDKNIHLSDRIGMQENEIKNAFAIKSNFIKNVMHEYNTPVTGITSTAQVLYEAYDKLSEEQRRAAAKTIFESSVRLAGYEANLVSLSKLATANYNFKMNLIDLSDLVKERVKTCVRLYCIEGNLREFELDIEDGLYVNGDRFYMVQVIDNLIVNSLQYSKEGKIIITLKTLLAENGIIPEDSLFISPNSIKENVVNYEWIEFKIIDQGIGIPKKDLYDIFSEFTVSSKTRTNSGGRGIGLSLCKKIITLHGGDIKAESNEKEGTTFVFTLPLHVI